jgi:hypothetical protein
MYRKGKDIRRKRHLTAVFFVPSVFGEKFLTAEFLNFLLGNRKKIAKCLMGTFTCRSTFLYAPRTYIYHCLTSVTYPPLSTTFIILSPCSQTNLLRGMSLPMHSEKLNRTVRQYNLNIYSEYI